MSEQVSDRALSTREVGLRYDALTKRAFDLAFSLIVLMALAPFFCLIAIAIKRDSPGPVIYRGARMGRGGRVFKILKFRTMYETPESFLGPKVTAHDDPRVTPLGHWLRNTKLNELPQFWNVLKGDMSLVGPRPEDPDIAEKWPKAVRDEILSVRPGITSPASVLYRNEEAMLCADDVFRQYMQAVVPDKMRLDQLYVRHCSFCLDMDTLLWTALILVPKIGSYQPPEKLLFVGPITRLVRRYVTYFVADLLVTLVAVGFTGLVWRAFGPLNVGWPKSVAAALALAVLFSVTGAVLGVNRVTWSKPGAVDRNDLLAAWATATVIAFAVNLWLGVLPFALVVVAAGLSLCGFVVVRYRSHLAIGLVRFIMRYRSRADNSREHVLIVGSGPTAQHAAWVLDQPGNAQRFQVCGFVDDDLFAQGMRVYGTNVIGTWRDIPNLVTQRGIKVVILADRSVAADRAQEIAEISRSSHVRFLLMPNLVDSLSSLCQVTPSICEDRNGARSNCFQCLAERDAPEVAARLEQQGGADV